jgi:hypothetical protein
VRRRREEYRGLFYASLPASSKQFHVKSPPGSGAKER